MIYSVPPPYRSGPQSSPVPPPLGGTFRTPKDDAPPYDPSLWEGGRDCFFLTKRGELQLLERRLQHCNEAIDLHAPKDPDAPLRGSASADLPSMFSWRYVWSSIKCLVLRRKQPAVVGKGPSPAELAALSFDELFLRFQAALQRGDVVESACYARELALRKAQVARAPPQGADGKPAVAALEPLTRRLHWETTGQDEGSSSALHHGFGRR